MTYKHTTSQALQYDLRDVAVLTIIVDNPYENLTNANKRSQHATHHLEIKGVNVPHDKWR